MEENKENLKPEKKKNKKDIEIENLKAELESKNDLLLRTAAEFDNFKKRSVKEKQDAYVLSKSDVIKELLPVLDNFDRAANNSDANLEDYKKGIELIFNQFKEILTKNGVESFGEVGDQFDPNIHNAIMSVEDENLGENTIAVVVSNGYRIGDRVLREAVVKVANS